MPICQIWKSQFLSWGSSFPGISSLSEVDETNSIEVHQGIIVIEPAGDLG